MRVRVTWPNGNEREVEVHTLRELDRFVGWHREEAQRVDLLPDGEGLQLVVGAGAGDATSPSPPSSGH